jgi:hypothetical protein
VVTIETTLPADAQAAAQSKLEQRNDLPPASVNYSAARDSLKDHVKKLVAQLASH